MHGRQILSIAAASSLLGLALFGCTGADGATGEQGIQGEQGPQGPQGDQGPAGPAGEDAPTEYAFWVGDLGPHGPIWTGPQQYPFICWTSESNLGQPVVDNWDGIGNAVYAIEGDNTSPVLGYSQYCGLPTRVDYFYLSSEDGRFHLLADRDNPPADIASVDVTGETLDFVVRVETGTLNRFIYTIAMLAPYAEGTASPADLDNSAWNERLIYYFRGGVGIGHWQGKAAWHGGLSGSEAAVFAQALGEGYAIAMSSGNEAAVHYNMQLAAETTYMVKQHFVETYGEPVYTVGIGGSGGSVQQYFIGQNYPGLLDAGIPMYSYPDMITQTIHIGDCNLLEQYFLEEATVFNPDTTPWSTWSNRKWIEGLNTSDTVMNSVFGTPGSSECIEGWYFGEPGVLNPYVTDAFYIQALLFYGYPPELASLDPSDDGVHWTHWDDLRNIYGLKSDGFAPIPADNVGVQYGLQALLDHNIGTTEFLRINSCVGSWKDQADYDSWEPSPANVFDSDNMNRDPMACRGPTGTPAPRSEGDLWAMQAAYLSGHVFEGPLTMPVIDLRPYLEEELNMHNSRQSFSVRERLLRSQGNSDNMVIWFTGSQADIPARVMDALGVLDAYLTAGSTEGYVDKCTDADGNLIAAGAGVWDGILDDNPAGACTTTYPLHSSSRMVAGDSIAGDMFKCQLKSVDTALGDGTYGDVTFTAAEVDRLNAIFPTGVCDYGKPDLGKPEGF